VAAKRKKKSPAKSPTKAKAPARKPAKAAAKQVPKKKTRAKKKTAKPAPTKKPPAKKQPTAKKQPAAKKKPAATKKPAAKLPAPTPKKPAPAPKKKPSKPSVAKQQVVAPKSAEPKKAKKKAKPKRAKPRPAKAEKPKQTRKPAKKTAAKKAPRPSPSPAKSDGTGEGQSREAGLVDEVTNALADHEKNRKRARDLRDALRGVADVPPEGLIALFRDGDPFGLRTEILLVLERLPEASYFEALLDALPSLARRSREWAFVALVRIVNTRGGAHASAARFEALCRRREEAVKRLVMRVLVERAAELDEATRGNVSATIRALGGDPKKLLPALPTAA
jgi:hypothetical protein